MKRRRTHHLANVTNALVPEDVERLRGGHWCGARLLCFRIRGLEEVVGVEPRIANVDLGKLHADTNLDAYHEAIVSRLDLKVEWSHLDDIAGSECFVIFHRLAIEDDRVLRSQREEVITVSKLLDTRLHPRH